MARKNLIGISETTQQDAATRSTHNDRPIAGFVPATRPASPVGGITRTLGNITEKMERAQDLERRLAQGQTIIELDPALIDSSFINDRLGIDAGELAQLVEQIRDHGQQVPILVRPHPETKGRYQVAYGHRRLAAIRTLGSRVKAVVRDLSDDQLVVSQGQENSARTNLSYIERALFAMRLEERAFSRDIIMSALGVDKAALSKMISVTRSVPFDIIEAIGAAPEIGRRRWMDFAEQLSLGDGETALLTKLSTQEAKSLNSDQRFQLAFDALSERTATSKIPRITAENIKDVPVRIRATGSGATFTFDRKAAPGFDLFVKDRLAALFAEYKKTTGD